MADNEFRPDPRDPRFMNDPSVPRGSPQYMEALRNQTPSHYLSVPLLRRKAWVRSNAARWQAEQEAIMHMQAEQQHVFLQQQIEAATAGMQQLMHMMDQISIEDAIPPSPPSQSPPPPTSPHSLAQRTSRGAVVLGRPPPPGHYANSFGRFVPKGFRYNARDRLVDERTPLTEYMTVLEEFWTDIPAENLKAQLTIITGSDDYEGQLKIKDLIDLDKLNFSLEYRNNTSPQVDEIVRNAVYLSHLVVLRHYFKKLLALAASDRMQTLTISANIPNLPRTIRGITAQIAKYDAMILAAMINLDTVVGQDVENAIPARNTEVNLTSRVNVHLQRLAGTKRRRGNINGPGAPPIIPRGTKKGRRNGPVSAPKQEKPRRPRPGAATVSTNYPPYTLRNDPANEIAANAQRVMRIAHPQIWNQFRRFKKRIRQDPYLPRALLADKTHEITRVDLAEDNTIRVYVIPVIQVHDPVLGTYYGHLVGAAEIMLPREEWGDLEDLWNQMTTDRAFENPSEQRAHNNATRVARRAAASAPLEEGMIRVNEGAPTARSVPVRRIIVNGVESYVPATAGNMNSMAFNVSAAGPPTRRTRGGKRMRTRSGKRMRTRSGKRMRMRKTRRIKRSA